MGVNTTNWLNRRSEDSQSVKRGIALNNVTSKSEAYEIQACRWSSSAFISEHLSPKFKLHNNRL